MAKSLLFYIGTSYRVTNISGTVFSLALNPRWLGGWLRKSWAANIQADPKTINVLAVELYNYHFSSKSYSSLISKSTTLLIRLQLWYIRSEILVLNLFNHLLNKGNSSEYTSWSISAASLIHQIARPLSYQALSEELRKKLIYLEL